MVDMGERIVIASPAEPGVAIQLDCRVAALLATTRLLSGSPTDHVGEESFERGQVVDAAVVADGQADDAGRGVFRGPDDGARFREFE